MTLEKLLTVLKRTDIPIYHYATKSMPELPYLIYTEYMEQYKKADNHISDTIISVQVDLYSSASDKNYKKIKQLLDEEGIAFEYRLMVETNEKGQKDIVIHHIFDCEVFDCEVLENGNV